MPGVILSFQLQSTCLERVKRFTLTRNRTHSGNHVRHDNDTRVYKAPITSYCCREDPLISAMSPSSAIERSHKEVPDDDRTTIKDTGDSQDVFVDDEEHDIQYKTLSWQVRPNWALLSSGAD